MTTHCSKKSSIAADEAERIDNKSDVASFAAGRSDKACDALSSDYFFGIQNKALLVVPKV